MAEFTAKQKLKMATLEELAHALGVTVGAIHYRLRRGKLPCAKKVPRVGKGTAKFAWRFPVEQAVKEWQEGTIGVVSRPNAPDPALDEAIAAQQEWRDARTQREFAKGRMAELEYRRKAGEVVEVKEVEARLSEVFVACRAKLLGIPTRARQRLPHLKKEEILVIDALVRESLEELSRGVMKS